ncbi:MAG: hypothetical protein ACFFCQ_01520 [Promethearchaeota archaeon]
MYGLITESLPLTAIKARVEFPYGLITELLPLTGTAARLESLETSKGVGGV